MSQLSFASLTAKKKTPLRADIFLEEMGKVVPWKRILRLLTPFYYDNKTGRPAYPLILMIKIYCLQQWYRLADLSMEEAIYDRRSFASFLEIDLMLNPIPDETTILGFRHFIEKHNLAPEIFHLINKFLEEKGLMMKEGTIVDATIISSPSSTKNNDKKRDPEMSSTRKNGQWYFGMKTHIGTDVKSGLVHSVEVTPAKTADVDMTMDLLHGEEKSIFGDKAYMKKEDKKWAREKNIFWGVPDRKKPKCCLSKSQRKRNDKLKRVRAKVEYPFRIIKELWGHRKTRYKGLYKNLNQMLMLFGLSNLYMSRKSLLIT